MYNAGTWENPRESQPVGANRLSHQPNAGLRASQKSSHHEGGDNYAQKAAQQCETDCKKEVAAVDHPVLAPLRTGLRAAPSALPIGAVMVTEPEAAAVETDVAATYRTWGNILLCAGGLALAIVWSIHLTKAIPTLVYNVTITLILATLAAGFLLVIVSSASRWVLRVVLAAVAQVGLDIKALAAALASLGAQVQGNTQTTNRLLASRTIDLNEFRDELRAAREHANTVADGAVKRVQEDMDEIKGLVLTLQRDAAEAAVDGMIGGNVTRFPAR